MQNGRLKAQRWWWDDVRKRRNKMLNGKYTFNEKEEQKRKRADYTYTYPTYILSWLGQRAICLCLIWLFIVCFVWTKRTTERTNKKKCRCFGDRRQQNPIKRPQQNACIRVHNKIRVWLNSLCCFWLLRLFWFIQMWNGIAHSTLAAPQHDTHTHLRSKKNNRFVRCARFDRRWSHDRMYEYCIYVYTNIYITFLHRQLWKTWLINDNDNYRNAMNKTVMQRSSCIRKKRRTWNCVVVVVVVDIFSVLHFL